MKKFYALLLCTALLLSLMGCGAASPEQTNTDTSHVVTDMSGNQINVPDKIDRYVILWAGLSDIVAMFDGVEHMVGYPATTKSYPFYFDVYPQVSDIVSFPKENISFESVLETNPQVVFMKESDDENLAQQLRDAGVAVLDCEFNNYSQLKQVVQIVADVFGTDEAQETAESFCNYVDDAISYVTAISETIPENEKDTVLVIRDTSSYSAYGLTRYTGQWVEMCGGVYAMVNEDPYANVQLTAEQLIEYDPDHIFFVMPSEANLFMQDPQWSSLAAVKNNQVYSNPCGMNPWSNCGAESVLQFKWALSVMYPNLADYDARDEIRDFYETYYGYTLTEEEIDHIINSSF